MVVQGAKRNPLARLSARKGAIGQELVGVGERPGRVGARITHMEAPVSGILPDIGAAVLAGAHHNGMRCAPLAHLK